MAQPLKIATILATILAIIAHPTDAYATYTSAEFCSADLCSHISSPPPLHTACNSRGSAFDYETCPRDAVPLTIDAARRSQILRLHNQFRSQIAQGQLANFEPSTRMVQLEWCDKLAYVASVQAGRCKFEHDHCRNTKEYRNAGQNIATVGQTGSFKPDEAAIDEMVKMWTDESADCSMERVRDFQLLGGPQIGHFTQLAHGPCYRVGCAGVKYKKGAFLTTLMFCNYAETNMLGQCVYETGETASGCKAGVSAKYPGLCKTEEWKFLTKGGAPTAVATAGGPRTRTSSSSSSSTRTSHFDSRLGPDGRPITRMTESASSSESGSPQQQLKSLSFGGGADPFAGLRQQMQLSPAQRLLQQHVTASSPFQTFTISAPTTRIVRTKQIAGAGDPFAQMRQQIAQMQGLAAASAGRGGGAGGSSVRVETKNTPTGVVTTRTTTDADGNVTTEVTEESISLAGAEADAESSSTSTTSIGGDPFGGDAFFSSFFN